MFRRRKKHSSPSLSAPAHAPRPSGGAPASKPASGPSVVVEGRLQLKGRVGFVLSDNPALTDVLVEGPTLKLAMDGDRVRARVTSGPEAPRRAGLLVEVVERARSTAVGAFGGTAQEPMLIPEEGAAPIRLIDMNGLHPAPKELVVARITVWPTEKEAAAGVLLEVLGSRDQPGVDLKALIRKFDLPNEFPVDVQKEAEAFGAEVPEAAYKDRETLFDQRVFTIDGKDAKDFDDAVSLTPIPNGVRLGVHIADVAQYVRPGTPLDTEAYRRGTSVYITGSVLPMLPFPLSDGLCSLRPDVVRLTLTCEMDIDAEGKVFAHRVFESAIRSAKRFTYDDVESILRGTDMPGLSPEIHSDVRDMGALALRLRKKRFARGSLDFDFPEPYIVTDPHGRPIDIQARERLESHRLVEDFMLLANETVAEHMSTYPFLYRIHEVPDAHKLEKLKKTLEAVGVPISKTFLSGKPSSLQEVIKYCEGKPVQPMVQTLMLRSLKQAVYSDMNKGHFGLASSCYTHFTSPIRRYPDLIVHRIIKERLHNELSDQRQAYWKKELPAMTLHCSRRERVAVEAEREFMDLQKARLMQSRVGEEFDGLVSGVTAFGIFIQLKDVFVEGLVRLSNLHDDFYVYDEVRMMLRGKRSGKIFQMGQPVRILLAAADVIKRQLDFELLSAAKPSTDRPAGSTARRPAGAPSPRPSQRSRRRRRTR